MPHYIALIHKETDSGYGVSFPDVPGVVTVGDSIDDAMRNAADVLAFAAEDWREQTGQNFPAPRSIDDLRHDKNFQGEIANAVVAAVPFRFNAEAAE